MRGMCWRANELGRPALADPYTALHPFLAAQPHPMTHLLLAVLLIVPIAASGQNVRRSILDTEWDDVRVHIEAVSNGGVSFRLSDDYDYVSIFGDNETVLGWIARIDSVRTKSMRLRAGDTVEIEAPCITPAARGHPTLR